MHKTETEHFHLLVVEDNPGDFVLLEEFLRLGKLRPDKVFHAIDMQSALSIATENPIDLILLDLTLPDSNGTDSVMTLDHLFPKTPIVVFSGLSTLEIAMESISLGAQDYLIKGEFDERVLTKAIQYSIERKKTQEKLRKSNELYEFVNKATQDTIFEWNFLTGQGLWGNGFTTTFGYPANQLQFDNTWPDEYVHPSDQQYMRDCIAMNIKNKTSNCDLEFRFRSAAGQYKEVHCRIYIIYDNGGKPQRLIGSLADITERRRLERELADQQLKQQRIITETTILAQEKERNELGRELHDNINQILATVKMYLGMAKSGRQVPADLLSKSYEYVEEVMTEIRSLSHTLVAPSLGETGLKEALESLAENTSMSSNLSIDVVTDEKILQTNRDKTKELTIYRIVQEQLNNIIKHAHANQVQVLLKEKNEGLLLTVQDDGAGFDPTQKANGIGLKNIRSRVEFYAGKLDIISAPGNGCRLEVYIPNQKLNK